MNKSIMTENSIQYTLKHLFKIANPNGNLLHEIRINKNCREVTVVFNGTEKEIAFNLVGESAWYELINAKSDMRWIDNARNTYKIPILFWVNDDLPFVTLRGNNSVSFNGDIISSSFFMLSRWEETQVTKRDEHGRFRFIDSIAYKHNFITIPVVDEYAMLLRKYLQLLFPRIDLGTRKFCIKLSHDIDDIRRFKNIRATFRTLGGDVIKSRSAGLVCRSLGELLRSINCPEKDPYFLGIYELATLSRKYNMDSAFYFKTSPKSDHDSGYNMDGNVRQCIFYLQEQGFEVGFHPGYYTFRNYAKFIGEKERLDKILGDKSYGGRQHYLRFDVHTTWKYWEQSGLKYDSTVGYAEHEGFRCGTSHPFRPFDIKEDREVDILEVPLIVMDGTLSSYRNLTPDEGFNSIDDLIGKCENVEGKFTLLWHNTSIYRGWEEWFEKVYVKVLQMN